MRIIVKSDQEPAIIDVQIALQELRPNQVIFINSPIGESESNGRAENSIRRVQEQVRTLRHHVEKEIGAKVFDESSIMA